MVLKINFLKYLYREKVNTFVETLFQFHIRSTILVGHNINKRLHFKGCYNMIHFIQQIFTDFAAPHKNAFTVLWVRHKFCL